MRPLDFKKAKAYLPYILLIGIGIGTSNFIIHGELNWFQWVIQASSTSFIIGFTIVIFAANKSWFYYYFNPPWKLYFFLLLAYFIVGLIATEIELIIKSFLFFNEVYQPFSGGSIYFFNGIISLVLGFSSFLNNQLFPKDDMLSGNDQQDTYIKKNKLEQPSNELQPTIKIPVKQGEKILLISAEDVIYFEAFDNYSFLYNLQGKKMLCDYSLIFLENRLDKNFLRIHRKYIVNSNHIKQITPYLNGRYIIEFDHPKIDKITSSKGYLKTVRKLIKIE